jgi:hypothetical protein
MKKVLRFGLIPALAGMMYLSLSSYSTGIMGKTTAGCGGPGCHAAGVAATVINITGLPATYTPGASYPLTLTVSNASYTAATNEAGFDLGVTGGLISMPSPGTMNMGTELHHTTPQVLVGSTATWTFTWTAPLTGTSTTFNVAGNVVNGTGTTSGDASNLYTTTINAAATSAPIVNTAAATAITATTATLNGIVNANGVTPGVGITFEYGLTTTYGNAPVGTPPTATGTSNVNSTAAITGLTPNTTYHFRVNGTTLSGAVTNGPDMTFKTLFAANVSDLEKLGIKVYPNPNTTGTLLLENVQAKNPSFSVIGIDGKAVAVSANKTSTNNYSIDIANLAAGLYTLQMNSEGKIFNTKFSKN